MTLIKFEPLREIENLHSRFQRYFEDFPNLGFESTENFSPKIDILDQDDNLIIEAEIPGVKKDDLKLTLQDNIITIQGEKKKDLKHEGKNFFRKERVYGTFKRCFTLPVDVDSGSVSAHFEDGMLTIEMKKMVEKPVEEKIIELK